MGMSAAHCQGISECLESGHPVGFLGLYGVCVFVETAGDDWSLPGGVQHHLQAGEARQTGHWRHPLVTVHPTQVIVSQLYTDRHTETIVWTASSFQWTECSMRYCNVC